MKKLNVLIAAGAAMIAATPAYAGNSEGQIQVKVLGTAVLPDGEITRVDVNTLGLGATAQTAIDDNYVPTVAVEYFVSPNFSIETICCFTGHDVEGRGGLAGAQVIDNALLLPATVTAKYHLTTGGFQPYVGAGVAYFAYFGEDPGATVRSLGVTDVALSNEFGFALQAGFNVPLNDQGLGLSVDAKRYFIPTTASFRNAAGAEVLRTRHDVDPWVLSAGLAYRF
jgi:outer membrane protein